METFIWGIGFGIIGMGYFSIGKRRGSKTFLYSGIALSIFPYFVDGLWENILVGAGLAMVPFVIKSV